jgi:hypothetical protein
MPAFPRRAVPLTVIVVTEFTAIVLVGLCLAGKSPYVLGVDPSFPPLRGVLERLAGWAVRSGRARWVVDLCPEERLLWEYPTRALLHDVFGATEKWHDAHFGFSAADRAVPRWATAYRQITCNYMKMRHLHALFLKTVADRDGGRPIRFLGVRDDTAEVMRAYWGRPFFPAGSAERWSRVPFNVLQGLVIAVFALGWIAARVRMRPPPAGQYFLAADYMEDRRDFPLYRAAAGAGPVLLVPREEGRRIAPYPELAGYDRCRPTDGRLAPGAAARAAVEVVREGLRLLVHFAGRPAPLFYQIAALPHRKIVLRAFFSRFRPRYYWGRDDYNVEHILRREEIHRVGGISLGVGHGYPISAIVYPMWRYISFDRYYMAGTGLYERRFKKLWPADMIVKAVGSLEIASHPRGRERGTGSGDIVIYSAMAVGEPAMTGFVRGLARAFPERKILLQVKHNFVETAPGRAYAAACAEGLGNVVLVGAGRLDVAERASYVFSDPSTILIETMQLGIPSFMIDVIPYHRTCIFRDYPGLCVRSANEAAERIRGIEIGNRPYPWRSYADLLPPEGRSMVDIVGEDLGLAAPNLAA